MAEINWQACISDDVSISERAEEYLDDDELRYVGSDGTLIEYDEQTSMCRIQFSDEYILTIPSEYVEHDLYESCNMSSIYEQMNKIDDRESLDEKYNVRTLKDVKRLQESKASKSDRNSIKT